MQQQGLDRKELGREQRRTNWHACIYRQMPIPVGVDLLWSSIQGPRYGDITRRPRGKIDERDAEPSTARNGGAPSPAPAVFDHSM